MKPKIAVITPYFKESTEMLFQNHASVLEQDVDATVEHYMVADGYPNPNLQDWKIKHLILPQSHNDNGNTPRGIGSMLAASECYDFIAYLDADNWYKTDHLSSLLNIWRKTRADVCCSSRTLHKLDGLEINAPLDNDELNQEFADTSTFFLSQTSYLCLDLWLKMPKQLSPICDRVFFEGLKNKNLRFAFSNRKTLSFRSRYKWHYMQAGISPPLDAKQDIVKEANEWLSTKSGTKETAKKIGFIPL